MSMLTNSHRLSTRSRPWLLAVLIRVAALIFILVRTAAADPPHRLEPPRESPPALTVAERSVEQDQGRWLITYRLRYEGATSLVVSPTEILAKVEGWVSNSRVAAHAVPRWSSLVASGSTGLSGVANVLTAENEAGRCRERARLQVWIDDPSGDDAGEINPATIPTPSPTTTSDTSSARNQTEPEDRPTILSLAPGVSVRVRLRLEHLHDLYGAYDPLLGARALELHLGGALLTDHLPLDHEHYLALPRDHWPKPPEDRLDHQHFLSAPDSLRLEAHVPGNQYYRFPERPVRYATKMRLRFYYFIAGGTEGACRARIAQYKETSTAWRTLPEGCFEECLTVVGRWVKVERIFRTEPEATTLALDFRITGADDIGEIWVDDVSLEPVASPTPAGP